MFLTTSTIVSMAFSQSSNIQKHVHLALSGILSVGYRQRCNKYCKIDFHAVLNIVEAEKSVTDTHMVDCVEQVVGGRA